MEIRRIALRGVVVVLACAGVALAPAGSARALTLEEAIALARERAVEAAAARARVADAEGALREAEVLLADDPVLEAQGGPRYVPDADGWIPQLDFELAQTFELSGARDARIEAARAALDGARAGADDLRRGAVTEAARAFVAVLAQDAAAHIAERDAELLEEILAIGERRASAGDLAALEVDRLRMIAIGGRSAALAVATERAERLAALRLAIRARPAETIVPEGELAELAARATSIAGAPRGEIAAAQAAARAADAEERLGRAEDVPELLVGIGYSFEEGDHMALATLGMTLPIFGRGRGRIEAARARRALAEIELDAAEARLAIEAETARIALEASVRALERASEAAALAEVVVARVQRAWEAGEVSVTELVAVRRDVLEVERTAIVRAADAALARIAWDAASGGAR